MSRRMLVPFLLVALDLLFFWPLVLRPNHVLYSDNSDALAQHIPYKRFLSRAWHETGEIPLWCPHSIGGAPFITDIQVSIFYPPNLLLMLVPEQYVAAGFSWLIVIQILIAGLSAYAYAREEGLGEAGGFVAGAGYMLCGKWLLHLLPAGHTVTIGLAWLPLVLLCFERSLRRRSLSWAAAAGAVLGLLVLGTQPQWTLYAGFFLIVWTAGTALEGVRGWRPGVAGLLRWIGVGVLTAGIALAVSAIQLLPTAEATEYSCRYVLGKAHHAGNHTGLSEAFPAWLGLVGPSLRMHPNWENQAGIGLIWAMAATAGAWLGWRKIWHRVIACLLVFAFALTGGLFMHDLPIFNLFRGPGRMLSLTGLPLALLAGHATDLLPAAVASAQERRRLLFVLTAVVVTAVLYTEARIRWYVSVNERYIHFYWLTLLITEPILFWLASSSTEWLDRRRVPLWCAVLVVDLLAISWPFVQIHRQEHVYQPSPTLDFLASRREDLGRVLDVNAFGNVSPFGCGAPLALNLGLYAIRGYNPMDFYRYKNYLQILSDSDLPSAPCEVVDGFRLKNRSLLDLLGMRYLLQPTARQLEDDCGWDLVFQDTALQVGFNYPDRGLTYLEPYSIYENEQALPRAFVVPHATAMPSGKEREALLATDFRKSVLVEGCNPADFVADSAGSFRAGRVTEYQPNQIKIEVEGDEAGWLVLTDMWYPGWTCTIDGTTRPVYRGDYLFRTVPLSAGKHKVVFRFLPRSYVVGRWITFIALVGLASWCLVVLARRRRLIDHRQFFSANGDKDAIGIAA